MLKLLNRLFQPSEKSPPVTGGFVYLKDPGWQGKLPEQPGVYWLLAMDESYRDHRGVFRPRPLGRLFDGANKPDRYGILYIGSTPKSGTLRQRAGRQLIAPFLTVSADARWRDFAGRSPLFDYLHTPGLASWLPVEKLALAWQVTDTHQQSARLEQKLYYNYRQQFGERPPFNRDFSMNLYEGADWQALRGPLVMEDDQWAPGFLRPGAPIPT